MARVAVLGSITLDLVMRTARLPEPGETLLAGSSAVFAGGKGLNQAVAARRLGAEVWLLGAVGEDALGEFLLGAAAAQGVNTEHVARLPGVTTGAAVPLLFPGGQNRILAAPGANMACRAHDVQLAEHLIAAADVLLLQLEVSAEANLAAARIARSAARPLVLNAAPAVDVPRELLELATLLVVNEGEAALLAPDASTDGERALALLAGRKAVVVTRGAEGVLVASNGAVETIPGIEVTAVDTVGAGDVFCGALAVGLAEGMDVIEAARWANAAAALSVTRSGSSDAAPARAEVAAFAAAAAERAPFSNA